jgi:very-short-patch-repair endonuclease
MASPDPAETRVAATFRPQPASRRSDKAISEYASSQHGVVTIEQLQSLGLSARGVRHRAGSGRLQRVHRGVYAVEGLGRRGRWMAGVLAAGPGAMLSHRSAAALWDLLAETGSTTSVTVPHDMRRQRPRLEIHGGTSLAPTDVTAIDGIPCTTLPRTLLDVAAWVDRRALTRMIDRAEQLREFDLRQIDDLLGRNRGRRGAGALSAALELWSEPEVASSVAEEHFIALVERFGLPAPEVNRWIPLSDGGGYSPDFLWREPKLIVEVDGRAYHARRRAFAHDRRRDRRLVLAGFHTIRYAASEVTGRPEAVAAELAQLLARTR